MFGNAKVSTCEESREVRGFDGGLISFDWLVHADAVSRDLRPCLGPPYCGIVYVAGGWESHSQII